MTIKTKITNKNLYGNSFYVNRDNDTKYAANRILSIVYEEFKGLDKVIDIGCGVGTFLKYAKKMVQKKL